MGQQPDAPYQQRYKSRAGCSHTAAYLFVYLMFFLPSTYLCTPSVEENIIQLPFSTVATLPKNKFFDKLSKSRR